MIDLRIGGQFSSPLAKQGDLVVCGNPRPYSLEFVGNRLILDGVERPPGEYQGACEVGHATHI